jgi:APA family basic amino acid/polyamine antiporter
MQAGNCLHSARLRQISFILIWLDRFTVIQTGVIAAIAVTFANYAAIFFPVLDQTLFTVGTSFVFSYQKYWLSSV